MSKLLELMMALIYFTKWSVRMQFLTMLHSLPLSWGALTIKDKSRHWILWFWQQKDSSIKIQIKEKNFKFNFLNSNYLSYTAPSRISLQMKTICFLFRDIKKLLSFLDISNSFFIINFTSSNLVFSLKIQRKIIKVHKFTNLTS